MKELEPSIVEDLLRQVRRIGATQTLIDIHVHATEIIFDEQRYNRDEDGVASTPGTVYKKPMPAKIRLEVPETSLDQKILNRISKNSFNKAYQHIGPKVLTDQMELCGISRAVMLPVARENLDFDNQWSLITEFSVKSNALLLGYCIPDSVPTNEILDHLRRVTASHDIAILKIHPNLTGVNLSTAHGMARLEAILAACNELRLPCLIHGGCSPILHNQPSREFAKLSQLDRVDWSITSSAVVIAHFGAYGCHPTDIDDQNVKNLNRLLDRHEHIFTDTSGVAYPVLRKMLGIVSHSRIVFGSDALYMPMWQAMAQLAHAANDLNGQLEQMVLEIAAENTKKVLNI